VTDVTPANALDPNVMAATLLHAQPGVFALMLGSGVSTGAGIPTGWGVVQELVRRAAAAKSPKDEAAPQLAYDDPEGWWAANGDGNPLGYSNLLGSLAPTPSARTAMLAGFFEPTEEDVELKLKTPSAAHKAIADLVKRGTVRVIVTTNFDRLTERALEDVGISPQVISNPASVAGMAPLQHATATVVKLHGDYADLDQRNTLEELTTYPGEWNDLLDRIFAEYGLVISGWSADWDHALVAALERLPVRRYPLFWDSRSAKGDTAQRLLALQRGVALLSADADELFTGLAERLDALDRLSEPPLTTALAIQRLKRYLPDERRRIDLHDLYMGQVEKVAAELASFPQDARGAVWAEFGSELMGRGEAVTFPLAQMASVGVEHDLDRRFNKLWINGLQRLLNATQITDGGYNENVLALRRYPALLYVRVLGIECMRNDRDDLLLDMLTKTTWRPPFSNQDEREIAADAIHDYRVLDADLINDLPRYGGTRWLYPASHYLREVIRPAFAETIATDDDFRLAFDDAEYAIGLIQHVSGKRSYPMAGEYIGERAWSFEGGPLAEARFRQRAEDARADWPWWSLLGGRDGLDTRLAELREILKQMQRWG
jgi:NAD-dependent SIR2 family protein deacetylase